MQHKSVRNIYTLVRFLSLSRTKNSTRTSANLKTHKRSINYLTAETTTVCGRKINPTLLLVVTNKWHGNIKAMAKHSRGHNFEQRNNVKRLFTYAYCN